MHDRSICIKRKKQLDEPQWEEKGEEFKKAIEKLDPEFVSALTPLSKDDNPFGIKMP